MLSGEEIDELYHIIPKTNIAFNQPMKRYTAFKIGGKVDLLLKAHTVEQVRAIIKFTNKHEIPLHIMGNGSNLLVTDEGVRGVILKSELKEMKTHRYVKYVDVVVQSGMPLGMLAQMLLKEKITGFEFAAGIPGTIGGAIRMNAGAHGSEMKDIVVSTTYMDLTGEIHTISNEEHKFEYRNSIFSKKDCVILETTLRLHKGDRETIKNTMDEYVNWRKENQPIEYPSAGSTFKRGKDFITAKVIDECGLKGYQIGGAQVSEKHAGFIINTGDATAQDVLDLVQYIKKVVFEKTGKTIELEIEVM